MILVSVNVGLPREVTWKDRIVTTGIFKTPVGGKVRVRKLNLDGDKQADLTVHGGEDKAVYVYPAEHYDYWRVELPEVALTWGLFGENLDITGISEDKINIGDRLRIGSALFEITQPRLPCYKLAVKFGRDDILRRFLKSGRTGFYLRVVEEGEINAGDEVVAAHTTPPYVTVADITRLYIGKNGMWELRRRAADLRALPASWRDYFRTQIEESSAR